MKFHFIFIFLSSFTSIYHFIPIYKKEKQFHHHCTVQNCVKCSPSNPHSCIQCNHKTFLYNNTCLYTCPINTFSDIKTFTCVPLNNDNIHNHFFNTKTYSIGSCSNICGKSSIDCSCEATCISLGNCCSDYSNKCEQLYMKNNMYNCTTIPHCLFCESDLHCGQCQSGYWLYQGTCIQSCSTDDYVNEHNYICERINSSCLVTQCEHCNGNVCERCRNGFYLYNNQCVKKCPMNYIADRREWKCVYAFEHNDSNSSVDMLWYMIFPSEHSCRDNCGVFTQYMDCSCREDCIRMGNCCEDVNEYCSEYIYWK